MTLAGFPHSGTPGSTPTCGSPRLFAACRALLRLSVPRHPPCALVRLTDRLARLPKRRGPHRSTDFPDRHTRWCSRALPLRRLPTQHPIPTTLVVNRLTTTRIEECLFSGRSTRERFLPVARLTRGSRKEVIQPQVPLRLPCYDFAPVTELAFGGSLPCGLGHRLRALPTPMA
jgi:hypothetical protein